MTGEVDVAIVVEMAGTRIWISSAAAYVALRVVLSWGTPPRVHPDSGSYAFGADLLGGHPRPWVPSFVIGNLPITWTTTIHAAISGIAFLLLALAIARQMQDRRVRWMLAGTVLAIGLTPRVTTLDSWLTSESLAISMTALLIAALAQIEAVPWWLVVTAFAFWVFTRDGHYYMGALILAGTVVWGVRRRLWLLPVGMAAVMLWATLAYGNDRYVEGLNVVTNISYHTADDPEMLDWFVDRGMPDTTALRAPWPENYSTLKWDEDFFGWAAVDGTKLYTRYLVTHPGFTLGGLDHFVVDSGVTDETVFDFPQNLRQAVPVGIGLPWPMDGRWMTPLVAMAALAAAAATIRHGWDQRLWLLVVLLGSAVPHVLLLANASPFEVGRHGIVVAFVTVVTAWWMVAIAADVTLSSGKRDAVDGCDLRTNRSQVGSGLDGVEHDHLVDAPLET